MKNLIKIAWITTTTPYASIVEKWRDERRNAWDGLLDGYQIGRYSLRARKEHIFPFPFNPLAKSHTLLSSIDVLRAISLMLDKEYDVLVSIQESSCFIPLLLKKVFKIRPAIIVLDPALDYNWNLRRHVLNIVLTEADCVLVRGRNQKSLLEEKYKGRCNVSVVYHPVDTRFWSDHESRPGDYIFAIGNDWARDFHTLLKALRDIEIPVIIKTNHDLSKMEVPANVTVIREYIEKERLRDLYRGAKFVVIPLLECEHASGVNSVLEAMAMGKATIISRSSGIMDYAVEAYTSLLVTPENVVDLSSNIRKLIENQSLVEFLGGNARRFVCERYNMNNYKRSLAEAIVSSVEKKRKEREAG